MHIFIVKRFIPGKTLGLIFELIQFHRIKDERFWTSREDLQTYINKTNEKSIYIYSLTGQF